MSLLHHVLSQEMNGMARKVFDRHFEIDPKLNKDYDDRRKLLMYEDILYNLGYLSAAMRFDEDKIFVDYAVWIYQLLCYLMKDLTKERIKDQMVLHFDIVRQVAAEELSEEDAQKIARPLSKGIRAIENQSIDFDESNRFEAGSYLDIKKKYLECLLKNDTKGASTSSLLRLNRA